MLYFDNFIPLLRLTSLIPKSPGKSAVSGRITPYVNQTVDMCVTICYNLITFGSGGFEIWLMKMQFLCIKAVR